MDVITFVALGLLLSAPPPEEVRRAAADVLSDTDIQGRYPVRGEGTAQPRTSHGASSSRPASGSSPPESVAATGLMWVLIIAAVALAAIYLGSRLGGYTADLAAHGDGAGSAGGGPRAPPPATEAEQLAAEGRYEQAIHTLLLLALHPLTTEEHLAESLTSREILRTVKLPDAAREAIGGLVGAVEIAVFGGRPPGREDYDRCAAHYERYCAVLGLEAA